MVARLPHSSGASTVCIRGSQAPRIAELANVGRLTPFFLFIAIKWPGLLSVGDLEPRGCFHEEQYHNSREHLFTIFFLQLSMILSFSYSVEINSKLAGDAVPNRLHLHTKMLPGFCWLCHCCF